jgi:hypothetical protein
MMQRGGQVMIKLLANVQHKTIEPFLKDTSIPGTRVYTDEYSIDTRLHDWGDVSTHFRTTAFHWLFKPAHRPVGRGNHARNDRAGE